MSHADFVHLRVHSAYSLAEGALKVKELVGLCERHAMPAVAVTDTGNLFGALEVAMAAAGAGVQPITGTVMAIARPASSRNGQPAKPDQLVLLVQDETGYQNLMALVSHAFLNTPPGEAPCVSWDDLEGRTDGLIALSGGPGGTLGRLLLEGQVPAAESILDRLQSLFPDRLYIELMRHGLAAERRLEPALIDLAYRRGLPLVATNDCFFADEGMFEAHDALLCIADGTYVAERDRRRVTKHHWFKPAAEMRALFQDVPEAVDNTLVIARRCAFMPEPRKPILPRFETDGGRSEADELRAQAEAGLEDRLAAFLFEPEMTEEQRAQVAKPYRDRLAFELDIIIEMGFAGYFLIVADFIKWSNANGIPVGPGRGSGAASVVAWSLTITGLDPIALDLVFERFLNPERVSMPDFDIDFCQDRRDEVIDYVRQKFGDDRVAQIITFGKLQARAVLRDVGRVLQMPYGQVDRLCKLVPNNPANPVTLQQAIDGEPALQQARAEDENVNHLIDLAIKLEGLYRHASTHAAGVVIGDRPLQELVPLYRDPRSPMPVTQFNMKYVEQAGLVKFDFLGLKTLTVLQQAVELVNARQSDVPDPPLDLDRIPLDDGDTYAMLCQATATGVFQLESSGMRDVLRQMKPSVFEDIIALVALYRPGPMDNIPTFIRNKHAPNGDGIDYLHPKLEPILKETYGIMVYQEQVMQAAQTLAGYTLGGADLLRRAMGKKIKAEMDAQKQVFLEGAAEQGIKAKQAGSIFDQIEKFAGYGFNKAHAAAYALVAYHTAYLKSTYPVEFMAASMTLDLHNTDKLNIFKQELDRMGIRLLPPDINASPAQFGVERAPGEDAEGQVLAIRYALGAIKGVGVEAMRLVEAERRSGGPYRDIFDFAERQDARVLNRRQIENLIKAGAFDAMNDNRAQLMAAVDTLLRHASAAASDRDSGQSSLFGGLSEEAHRPRLPIVSEWDSMEALRQEFEAVGFYLSAHPIDNFPTVRVGAVPSSEIGSRFRSSGRSTMKVAGIVLAKREMTTKTGNRMAFVQMSDAGGVFEITLFVEALVKARPLLEAGTPLLAVIEVQARDEDLRLTATDVTPLDDAVAQAGMAIQVHIDRPEAATELHGILERMGQGRGRVSVMIPVDHDGEAEIVLPQTYAIGTRGRAAIKSIPGVSDVREF
ncbi:MAG: DNA polymerase III subunit alpha [Pseudomonadota bacterium]